MTRKSIPAAEAFAEGRKDPKYVKAYQALEEEFTLADALIRARSEADMTQEQVARAMGTTQSAVARREGDAVHEDAQALCRRYGNADATGTRLRIQFEREGSGPLT